MKRRPMWRWERRAQLRAADVVRVRTTHTFRTLMGTTTTMTLENASSRYYDIPAIEWTVE